MKKSQFYLPVLALATMLIIQSCKKTDIENFDEGGLLKNSSVEFGNTEPETWVSYPGQYSNSWELYEAYDGSHSLKVTSNLAASADIGYWRQSVTENIPVNKHVTLDLYLKMENVKGNGVILVIRGDNDLSKMVFIENTLLDRQILGTSNWERYTVESKNVVPASVRTLNVFLVLSTSTLGTVYFDKISLTAQ